MIRSTIILCSLVILGIVSSIQAAPSLHKRFAGQGTFYEVGLGACGNVNSDSQLVAALSAPQFGSPPNPNNSPFCGRQVKVNGPNGSVTVTLVDRCEACQFGDLDLSPTAFQQIAPLSAGRVQITWDFVGGGGGGTPTPQPPKPQPKPPKKPKKPKRKHRKHRHH